SPLQRRDLQTVKHAGERLGQGCDLEGHVRRQPVGAAFDEAPGDEEVLGEGAVEIVEVRAEVLPAPGAPLADAAGRGVGHHHPVARLPASPDSITYGG